MDYYHSQLGTKPPSQSKRRKPIMFSILIIPQRHEMKTDSANLTFQLTRYTAPF